MTEQYTFNLRNVTSLIESQAITDSIIDVIGPESKRLFGFTKLQIPIPNVIVITKTAFEKLHESLQPEVLNQEPVETIVDENQEQSSSGENVETEKKSPVTDSSSSEQQPSEQPAVNEEPKPKEEFLPILLKALIDIINSVGAKGGLVFGDSTKPIAISISEDSFTPIQLNGIGLNEESVQGLVKNGNNANLLYEMIGQLNDSLNQTSFFSDIFSPEAEQGDFDVIWTKFKESGTIINDVTEQLKSAINFYYKRWQENTELSLLISFDTYVQVDSFGFGVYKTRFVETGVAGLNGFYSMGVSRSILADSPKPLEELGEEPLSLLNDVGSKLEAHYKALQEIEFEIQFGDIGIVERRNVEITEYHARLRIAIDFAKDKIISYEVPLKIFDYEIAKLSLKAEFEDPDRDKIFAECVSLSPYPASGNLTFNLENIAQPPEEGSEGFIYCAKTMKIEDIDLIKNAKGIMLLEPVDPEFVALANYLKIPIVTSILKVKPNWKDGALVKNEESQLIEGDPLSIDGAKGIIYATATPIIRPDFKSISDIQQLIAWSDEVRKARGFQVFVTADSLEESDLAALGADGIGLYKTEQPYLSDKVSIINRLIFETNPEEKEAAQTEAEDSFTGDFAGIFEIAGKSPVYVRLFDAPIDLFLPDLKELADEIAEIKKSKMDEEEDKENKPPGAEEEDQENDLKSKEELLEKCQKWIQTNPLISCRGVRLFQMIPKFLELQVRSLIQAAYSAAEKLDEEERSSYVTPVPMLPYVVNELEVAKFKELVDSINVVVQKEKEFQLSFKVGAMIEVPRSCLVLDKIADKVDVVMFNFDVLQQTGFGLSEIDVKEKLIARYCAQGLFEKSPFAVIDTIGVGTLIEIGIQKLQENEKKIVIGAVGPHCADLESNSFLQKLGTSFVAVPIDLLDFARLFSAQVLLHK